MMGQWAQDAADLNRWFGSVKDERCKNQLKVCYLALGPMGMRAECTWDARGSETRGQDA